MEKAMRNFTSEKRGLSVRETCDVGGFGRSRFYEVVATGQLVARKFGRRTIVLREDLDRFLDSLPATNGEAAVGKPAQT
jgi:predicted DNA-binding transcriptional regulator AlpA